MDDNIHRYAKTPRAWQAIARRDLLGREAHALLLMVNGRRTDQEIARLLGADVKPLLQDLEQQGYLQYAAIVVPETDDDALESV
ncbi:hypothetical protein [Hydrogenophaga sp. 2FB]|uniref:hypothetical protein n=1 Tax=Hydrogenophaga sp. 2FB TaxID=2502187 RepID=UPI0010F917F0|nr:hypothetical protein [Hydrogenophaga sp. 2FB]